MKLITSRQLDKVVQCQVLFGGRLGTNLLELGFISEDELRRLLENKHGQGSVSRKDLIKIPRKVIDLVPGEYAQKYNLVPVRLQNKTLEVAMLDPWRESSIKNLTDLTSKKITPLIALELDLLWALEKYYGIKRQARFINLDRWLQQHGQTKKGPGKKKKKNENEKTQGYKDKPLFPDPQSITAMEGTPGSLNEFWDRVGRSSHPEYHLPKILSKLRTASSRDEISGIILDFSAMFFKRTLLFVANEDILLGWDGRGEGIDTNVALAIMLPLSRKSIFKTVMETGAYFLGPIPDTPVNRRFKAALGPARPKTVLLLPLFVSGKIVAILYGDMGNEKDASVPIQHVQNALAAAGKAFHRLIVKQKSQNPKS